ncbi:hypothetical protein JAAARDRAFT_187409 [Jaapia argillacea MUCL 33604]|uniref:Uncharacterized protein n=1 Tax=Jaapia argillacea MUCL 33604 TaxID=933084 RepID=A0A067QN24_9AGAM|nr:hypothetical protein JAAARDRAFT_187409 [Jaapia argillacea MUCL 33604]
MRPLCIKILEKIIPPTEGDHLKTLAIQTYILLHLNGCLDEEIRACWVLGMQLELTLGNVVWGTACQGGLPQSKPSPVFDQVYAFFFSYDTPSDLDVPISWESISSVLSIESFTRPDSIQYLQLLFWWDQPNLRDSVYELMMATGMSEVSMDWVIAGRVPDFLWWNGSHPLLGQNAFPWELELMGFDVESQSDYLAEQLQYDSILARAYRRLGLPPSSATHLRPSQLLSRASAISIPPISPKMTDGTTTNALCKIMKLQLENIA